jgi:hypothetical protein
MKEPETSFITPTLIKNQFTAGKRIVTIAIICKNKKFPWLG